MSPLRFEWVKEQCCHDRPDRQSGSQSKAYITAEALSSQSSEDFLIKNSLLSALGASQR